MDNGTTAGNAGLMEQWPYGPLNNSSDMMMGSIVIGPPPAQPMGHLSDEQKAQLEEMLKKVKKDNVNNPSHYTNHPSGVECIEITEHYDFCVGNAIKYLWRQGLKEDSAMDSTEKQIEDCKKAIWYIQRHITNLEKNHSDKREP